MIPVPDLVLQTKSITVPVLVLKIRLGFGSILSNPNGKRSLATG
jgi:hypothetical protein